MVLGKILSSKTINIESGIREQLNKPVIYYKLEEKGSFGKCGQDETNYYIWLDENLPQYEFEVNLVHELLHLCQMQRDLPDTRAINVDAEGENAFACSINALILDLEVEDKLKRIYELDSLYFSQTRLKQMQFIRNTGFKGFANNDFLQKYSAIRLALYAYVAPADLSAKMHDCFSKRFPKVVIMAKKIQSFLSVDFNENDNIFNTMKSVIEYLNIGDHVKICYNNTSYLYCSRSKEWLSEEAM
ncbi:hypothetical protein ACOBQJ_10905 [Pelotomaculum propionicicum]|uniref:hypothetical protein n=1 Tax=Pelotomaculum propionicicum TaxID=258475 RepID=UPI003B81FE7E